MQGVERYFFDAYYNRGDESSLKELKLSGGRRLKKDEYHALEGRFDKLGKGIRAAAAGEPREKGPAAVGEIFGEGGP